MKGRLFRRYCRVNRVRRKERCSVEEVRYGILVIMHGDDDDRFTCHMAIAHREYRIGNYLILFVQPCPLTQSSERRRPPLALGHAPSRNMFQAVRLVVTVTAPK